MDNNENPNQNNGEQENNTPAESQTKTEYSSQNTSNGYFVEPPKKQTKVLKIVGIILLVVIGIPLILFGICILILSSIY